MSTISVPFLKYNTDVNHAASGRIMTLKTKNEIGSLCITYTKISPLMKVYLKASHVKNENIT